MSDDVRTGPSGIVLRDVTVFGKPLEAFPVVRHDKWQPIETAPKDGTPVDVWVVGYSDEPMRITNASFGNGHWWFYDDHDAHQIDGNAGCLPSEVTHWLPIPEPPL